MNAISSSDPVCPACRSQHDPGARFCTHCGAEVAAAPDAHLHYDYFHACSSCGGDGSRLPVSKVYCAECRWLRPLTDHYAMDVNAFLYELDAQAMSVLQSLGPVTSAARALSEKVGRPWFEAATNGIRLSETQLPDIFEVAVRAARIIGLAELPEIYVSGEQMWDALTLGSDEKAFIVIGSVLTYFKGDELLFLFAREMGHVRAGHVLWKTASKFLTGSTHMNRSIMGGGLINALNPTKMLENAIDAPMMAWSRHSEITADRAGMLAIGNDDVARKVLMSWAMKSFPLYQRLNQDDWLQQERATDDQVMRFSEMTMSTMPYIARRMRLLREYGQSPECQAWRAYIKPFVSSHEPAPVAASKSQAPTATNRKPQVEDAADVVRFACTRCKEPIRVPLSAVQGKDLARVRCPNETCKAVLNLRWRDRVAEKDDPSQLRMKCVQCSAPMVIPRAALAGKEMIKVRCPIETCRCVLEVRARRALRPRPEAMTSEATHE